MVVTLGISNYVSPPIQLGAPQYLDFESRIALPKGFWSSVPPSVDEKKDFAEYSSSASLEDGVLRGTRHLKILRPKISPREIAEYSALHKTIVDDFGTWIVVVEGLGPQPHSYEVHGSKNPDAQRLFDEASQSMAMGAPFSASKSLEQALKLDPKWADAWLLLGAARLNSDFDAAVVALRKGISLNPSDPRGHQMLARVLLEHRRRPEAIQAFRDFLKLQPDDSYASATLAYLLLDVQSYADARPLLEKLSAKRPDDAYVHVQLGTAYLRLGEDDKASEQFHKAVNLQPGEETLNNVAWALGDAGKRLPEALGYALQAVREVETRSADQSSLSAKEQRLGLMGSMAAYWDTLGWIYFRMDDLNTAQKYLSAAWALSLDPSIGDHLVQVYDKQGRKDRAAQISSLALAAIPVNGDSRLRNKFLARGSKSPAVATKWGDSLKDLARLSEFRLSSSSAKEGTAQFELTLAKGQVADEVKFIRGNEDMRDLASTIKTLQFNAEFPDDGPTKIVRRGDVTCSRDRGCSFHLWPVNSNALPMLQTPPQTGVLQAPGA